MVRDQWRKGYTKQVSFEFRVKEVMDGKSGEEKDGLRQKLVHEVKQKVCSRDEARHTERSDL